MQETMLVFDENKIVQHLKHYLPAQATLKDFVHHNSLHAFQDKEFFEGIFSAKKIFGFRVTFSLNEYRKLYQQGRIKEAIIDWVIIRSKGIEQVKKYKQKMLFGQYDESYNPRLGSIRKYWKQVYKIDLDNRVQPLLFRLLASYLDQGIALWHFPFEDKGLLNAVRMVENNSYASFFKSKRAIKLLHKKDLTMQELLDILVGRTELYEQYLMDQQYTHKGWSGIVGVIEEDKNTIFYKKEITLRDLIKLELLLEIDALDSALGNKWPSLGTHITETIPDYFSSVPFGEQEEILQLWQEAFEWDYYDEVLSAVRHLSKTKRLEKNKPSFQAMFCVDDRECSLRRHIELIDPNYETLGAPGFFGAAIYFQPYGGKFYDKNCPVALTPKHLIKEIEIKQHRKKEHIHSSHTHATFRGLLSTFSLGMFSGIRMLRDLFNPKMQPDISDAFAHMDLHGKLLIECADPDAKENGLQVGYTVQEMADIVYSLLKGIGLTDTFSDVVYVVAHGSSSANNPHHGAHDCGACSGRPGAVNARVFAYMANHSMVRKLLAGKGILVPEQTQFIAAMHDTASDEVNYYDRSTLSDQNYKKHLKQVEIMEKALDLNAKERARRFASINVKQDIKKIRKKIKQRSVSYFEPRPELGHGTNALCYVGGRQKMKGLFLDRRAFLQSYDYTTDPKGEVLAQVLAPLPAVCGGINLEYYFSRMDIEKMGAGTKLPHNVTGLIGVTNSSDGDLRTGLPLQMIENHDPVRLLMMVEHTPEVIMNIITSSSAMYDWFDKGWIHLVVVAPDGELYHFDKGTFVPYNPFTEVKETDDILKVIEEGIEMETNHILDATKENISVHVHKD